MSVQDMLKEMSSRVFNSSYDSYMRNAYAFFAGFFHGKYKPYLIIGLKMIFEISSPFLSINRVKQFQKTTT